MARYSKVDRRTWSDEKFNRLTPAPPSGRYLWIYLLTNPHQTSIPGIFVCGEAMLAEALGWPLQGGLEGLGEGFAKGFREVFRELVEEGMAEADWKARVIHLPNAWKYNFPENPNVVKSWRTAWDEIPECQLKLKAWQRLNALMQGKGKKFVEAFRDACPKPGKGLGNGMPNGMANPEPEPEQDINDIDKGAERRQNGERVDRESGEAFGHAATTIPPTIEAVTVYMARIMVSAQEAQKFYDFYTAKGWMVGSAHMKNWQAACRNWKANQGNFEGKKNGNRNNQPQHRGVSYEADRALTL